MLLSLNIQNVVLIDQLRIDLKEGLCALTGETGAGKSILLDSLGLAIGRRGEARLVRKGADQAQVTAEFDISPSHPAFKILQNSNISVSTGEALILRRIVTNDGRSRCYINDQPVSVGVLNEVGETLVEVHGQFDTHALLNPATHLGLLDEYAGVHNDLENLWASWREEKERLIALQNAAQKSQEEEDYIRKSLEDLDELNPQEGEEESLSQTRARLMGREKVMAALGNAYQALTQDDDHIGAALGALDRVADELGDEGAEIINALERARTECDEAISYLQSLSSDLENPDQSLEEIDDRLYALRSQSRKHGCTPDELPHMREKLAGDLDGIENAEGRVTEQSRKVEKARQAYIDAAEKISEIRGKAATKLDKLIAKELPPLKLEKAKFVTAIEKLEEKNWTSQGWDSVRFLVSTNPGSEPGPLNKIASGGEMARFMLALKVVMAETGAAPTLIFDEVDTGIGGSTADAVGERLSRVSKSGKQVLVVTHSPQVAARATHHYIVKKDGAKEVKTNVEALNDNDGRREEIARMLAGASITEEARAAAAKLLETGS